MADGVQVNTDIRPGGAFGVHFCSAPHPTRPDDWCRRLKGHDGPHGAYTFSIHEPERW